MRKKYKGVYSHGLPRDIRQRRKALEEAIIRACIDMTVRAMARHALAAALRERE